MIELKAEMLSFKKSPHMLSEMLPFSVYTGMNINEDDISSSTILIYPYISTKKAFYAQWKVIVDDT